MTPTRRPARYQGVFPVVPTLFDERGGLDLDGRRRCVDFMIDAGSIRSCCAAKRPRATMSRHA